MHAQRRVAFKAPFKSLILPLQYRERNAKSDATKPDEKDFGAKTATGVASFFCAPKPKQATTKISNATAFRKLAIFCVSLPLRDPIKFTTATQSLIEGISRLLRRTRRSLVRKYFLLIPFICFILTVALARCQRRQTLREPSQRFSRITPGSWGRGGQNR